MTKPRFNQGQKVTITGESGCNHGFQPGTVVTIQYKNGTYWLVQTGDGLAKNVYERDIKPISTTKDSLMEELKIMKDKVSILQLKLDYLEETKLDAVNDTEFKVYHVLQTLKTKGTTDLEKAQVIACLIEE